MSKKKIKVRRPGLLGGKGYTSLPARERRQILRSCIEDEGVVTCQRALLAMQSWSSSGTWAASKRKAVIDDLAWIAGQLPNEPAHRAAERLRRSLLKGKTMQQALKSAKARVGRITDPEKLEGAALYFGSLIHYQHDLTQAQCRLALEAAEAALEKMVTPAPKKKKSRKNSGVVNMYGVSLERYPRMPLEMWEGFSTIQSGHFDNLIYEGTASDVLRGGGDEKIRVWRSRMTVADGMPCDDLITVEAYKGPDWIWEKVDEYCPRSGREANPGVVEPRRSNASLKARLVR